MRDILGGRALLWGPGIDRLHHSERSVGWYIRREQHCGTSVLVRVLLWWWVADVEVNW